MSFFSLVAYHGPDGREGNQGSPDPAMIGVFWKLRQETSCEVDLRSGDGSSCQSDHHELPQTEKANRISPEIRDMGTNETRDEPGVNLVVDCLSVRRGSFGDITDDLSITTPPMQ